MPEPRMDLLTAVISEDLDTVKRILAVAETGGFPPIDVVDEDRKHPLDYANGEIRETLASYIRANIVMHRDSAVELAADEFVRQPNGYGGEKMNQMLDLISGQHGTVSPKMLQSVLLRIKIKADWNRIFHAEDKAIRFLREEHLLKLASDHGWDIGIAKIPQKDARNALLELLKREPGHAEARQLAEEYLNNFGPYDRDGAKALQAALEAEYETKPVNMPVDKPKRSLGQRLISFL